ncbi:MAG: hypothetical protein RL557_394 [archaeon]
MEDIQDRSVEDLAFFFRSCPIIVPTQISQRNRRRKQKQLLFGQQNSGEYGYAIDFDNGEGDERLIRKGLWYIGGERYSYIWINDHPISLEEKSQLTALVPYSERPWPFISFSHAKGFMFPVRVPIVNPVYLHPFEKLTVQRGKPYFRSEFTDREYDPLLTNVMNQWIESKQIPPQLKKLFEDSSEDQQKLHRMIGSKTYRISENKEISPEIKRIADEKRTRNREKIAITLSDLETVVSMVALQKDESGEGYIPLINPPPPFRITEWFRTHDNHPYSVEHIQRAVHSIAQAAYEIRRGYKRKGWEVRDGLVHRQAYKKLERMASEKAHPEIVHQILEDIKQDSWNNNYPQVIHDLNPMYHKPELSTCTSFRSAFYYLILKDKIPSVSPEVYEQIGELRVQQWLSGAKPYSRELDLMCRIMNNYLAKTRFREEVNQWLQRHIQRTVDWKVIDLAIR